jgi:hypothetical protein
MQLAGLTFTQQTFKNTQERVINMPSKEDYIRCTSGAKNVATILRKVRKYIFLKT